MSQEKLPGKKIVICTPEFDVKVGGSVALHVLAKELIANQCKVMLFLINGDKKQNDFCNKYATPEDIDDSTVVVYPEIIEGNPLNAKHVVRWMLCGLGVHSKRDIYKTWGNEDLVFHYSAFNGGYSLHDVEILHAIWLDPTMKDNHLPRSGSCYLFKKASSFHKKITMIHPKDAILIDSCSLEEVIDIFNRTEYFYCYDPYSFYTTIAALCGCIPIVYPIEGLSKEDWVKTKSTSLVCPRAQKNLSGIAYGIEDIQYAKETLCDVRRDKADLIEFGKKTVRSFIGTVEIYFFEKKKNKHCKTVGMLADRFWSLRGEAVSDDAVSERERLKKEIAVMRASKFWKFREKYMAVKSLFFRV